METTRTLTMDLRSKTGVLSKKIRKMGISRKAAALGNLRNETRWVGECRPGLGDPLALNPPRRGLADVTFEPQKRSKIGESTRSPAFVLFYLSFLATHLVP